MRKAFQHGLVIGKFYPPHAGHEYLIKTAADHCGIVTVVAMAATVESIALQTRVEWLKEIFAERVNVTVVGIIDDEPVDYHDGAVWSAHVALMQRGVALADEDRGPLPSQAIDAVFTSEDYGDELARRFDAAHVCVDHTRALYPVSGTSVRKDPSAYWDYLSPCVRASLTLRIAIVGAESTGKTTLAAALAQKFRERGGIWTRTQWVAEYGREFTANSFAIAKASAAIRGLPTPSLEDLQWHTDDFVLIAKEQLGREDQAVRHTSPVLICDTDAFATAIWHQRYLGTESEAVKAVAQKMSPRAGYILSAWQEVPFEQDGLRDGEHLRGWMHEVFATQLKASNVPWMEASGTLDQRVKQCVDWIDHRLRDAWCFADPLG